MTTVPASTVRTWLEDLLADMSPAERAAIDAERRELDEALRVPCAWGLCTQEVSRATGKILGGMGPVGCPCDLLPGWRSKYPAGTPKPAAPVKARGRHGSRRQRAITRRRDLCELYRRDPDFFQAPNAL